MVQYSNGRFKAMSYVLDRPFEYQYKRKQDGIQLSGIQMVGLSGNQMAFEY